MISRMARLRFSPETTLSLSTAGPWLRRVGLVVFVVALLYPLTGLFAPVGPWQWDGDIPGSTLASVATSLELTAIALAVIAVIGTPVAWHLARKSGRRSILWEAAILVSVLMPPLALGILLSLAFGPETWMGRLLLHLGLASSNSPLAFTVTQVYVGMGYYILAARAAFSAVPAELEAMAALLGRSPVQVFWRVTFPLSRLGLAAALSIAWVRTLGEFGAIVVTAYYPAGMPVQLWINLQDRGLPAVMPLLVVFLLCALPLPWLAYILARRRPAHA